MRVPLRETVPITLNGAGGGTASVGPRSAREVWYPGNVHVSANQNPTSEAVCRIYVGLDTSQSYFRDETPFGSSGDSSGTVNQDTVRVGQKISAVWSGGDPGVQAVLTVTGFKDV